MSSTESIRAPFSCSAKLLKRRCKVFRPLSHTDQIQPLQHNNLFKALCLLSQHLINIIGALLIQQGRNIEIVALVFKPVYNIVAYVKNPLKRFCKAVQAFITILRSNVDHPCVICYQSRARKLSLADANVFPQVKTAENTG